MEDSPTRNRHQSRRVTLAPVIIAMMLGGFLLMLWPSLFALLFGVLLLLQSCIVEQEFTVMSSAGLTLYSSRPRLSSRIRPFLSAYLR